MKLKNKQCFLCKI